MTFKFTIISDEVEDFVRIININSEATFFDFHKAILDAVKYTPDQISSFFTCSDDWEKDLEITLIEMDSGSEFDNYVMDRTKLEELLDDEKQKLLYTFDMLSDRAFFIELTEIVTGEDLDKPQCSYAQGNPPKQLLIEDIQDLNISKVIIDDNFIGEESLNIDEFDEEDFGDITISEGNPFEDNF